MKMFAKEEVLFGAKALRHSMALPELLSVVPLLISIGTTSFSPKSPCAPSLFPSPLDLDPSTHPLFMSSSKPSIEELRVSQQELSSGNTKGQVFVQLSKGAVAFLTDRLVVQARVSRQLRERIDAEPPTAVNLKKTAS
jgi:hypothetical protein